MKKRTKKLMILTAVAIVAAVCLASCSEMTKEEKARYEDEQNKAIVGHFRKLEYKGHSYIVYREYHGQYHTFSGITHDPDCNCEFAIYFEEK